MAAKISSDVMRTFDCLKDSAVGVSLTDNKGRFIRVNKRYTTITGYSEAELITKTYPEITHVQDVQENQSLARKMYDGELASAVYEKRYVRKSGEICWVRNSVVAMHDSRGQLTNVLAVTEDISELKEVRETERRRLARELHDEIGQLLTGLMLLLNLNGYSPSGAFGNRLEQARALVNDLISRVRGLSFDLRPAALDQFGLLPALLALFERYTTQTGVLVNFKHQGIQIRFSAEEETAAYRFIQEALTNVARHADVSAVSVYVWGGTDTLNIQIIDQGRGFDPEVVLKTPGSSGLIGMRERMVLLGGRMTIDSLPGAGSRITAEMPLAEPPKP